MVNSISLLPECPKILMKSTKTLSLRTQEILDKLGDSLSVSKVSVLSWRCPPSPHPHQLRISICLHGPPGSLLHFPRLDPEASISLPIGFESLKHLKDHLYYQQHHYSCISTSFFLHCNTSSAHLFSLPASMSLGKLEMQNFRYHPRVQISPTKEQVSHAISALKSSSK